MSCLNKWMPYCIWFVFVLKTQRRRNYFWNVWVAEPWEQLSYCNPKLHRSCKCSQLLKFLCFCKKLIIQPTLLLCCGIEVRTRDARAVVWESVWGTWNKVPSAASQAEISAEWTGTSALIPRRGLAPIRSEDLKMQISASLSQRWARTQWDPASLSVVSSVVWLRFATCQTVTDFVKLICVTIFNDNAQI